MLFLERRNLSHFLLSSSQNTMKNTWKIIHEKLFFRLFLHFELNIQSNVKSIRNLFEEKRLESLHHPKLFKSFFNPFFRLITESEKSLLWIRSLLVFTLSAFKLSLNSFKNAKLCGTGKKKFSSIFKIIPRVNFLSSRKRKRQKILLLPLELSSNRKLSSFF